MSCYFFVVFLFFVFKQKTAYEMRISDWSSDVCSSDLNLYVDGGTSPDLEGGKELAEAFGGALPAVMWDGLDDGQTPAVLTVAGTPGWSVNLPRQGADATEGTPSPLDVPAPEGSILDGPIGAPAELTLSIAG